MRFFDILNIQHFVWYLFPAIIFIALFILGLGFYHITRKGSAVRESRIIERFPGGIEGRDAPFPLFLILVIAGTIVWVIAYIFFIGILKVIF